MRIISIFAVLLFLLIIGCAKSVEPTDNYTFKVVNLGETSVDTFAARGYEFVLRYVKVDKDYCVNKIYLDNIGELTVERIDEEGTAIFRLDEKYLPCTYMVIFNYIIELDTMKGGFSYGGPTIDTPQHDFVAAKGLK